METEVRGKQKTKKQKLKNNKKLKIPQNGFWEDKMEHGLLKTYALAMEDKMAAAAFGRARNYGLDRPLQNIKQH